MEKLDFVRKINIYLRIGPKQIDTFLCSSDWLNTANRRLISFHGKHIWHMLTLIWFLFGMNSYVIFLQNLFAKLTLQWFLFGMGSYKCGTPSA